MNIYLSSILFNYQKIVEIVKIDFLQKIKKSSNSILNEKTEKSKTEKFVEKKISLKIANKTKKSGKVRNQEFREKNI